MKIKIERRIKLVSLVFILALLFPPFCSYCEKNLAKALLEQGRTVEEEIDALLKKAHKISVQASSSGQTSDTKKPRIITPAEVVKSIIPPDRRNKRMDLDFEKADLEGVLKVIGEAGGFNIVLDPSLKGKKVDLHLKNVPIDEALSLLYSAYDLGSMLVGNSLFVSTREKIQATRMITRVIRLENVPVKEAEKLIDKMVETINVSEGTNTLVVSGAPEDVDRAESILRGVDRPQPQVILEAKIIEINKDALKDLGIDWPDSIIVTAQESRRPASLEDTETAIGSPFRIYKFARSAINFEATLKMLETDDKARVLSSPHITTLNNKEAEIFVGDKVPYTITTVTGGVATTEVRFVEPGIRLKITPSIIEKDFVVIKIEPEVSYIYSWRGANDEYPWVKSREATAYVRVKNGQPFVLGGLLTKEDKVNISRIPFLGSMPFFGSLFSHTTHTVTDSELIITVIPTIVYE